MTEEWERPCPHGGSIVSCNACLNEYLVAEELLDDEKE